jgi:hypothetical protein
MPTTPRGEEFPLIISVDHHVLESRDVWKYGLRPLSPRAWHAPGAGEPKAASRPCSLLPPANESMN